METSGVTAQNSEDRHCQRLPSHLDHDGWPTTLCFCRRMGEQVRGPDYATAFEPPSGGAINGAWKAALAFFVVFVLGLLATAAVTLFAPA